jgi:hypothetical protein
VDLAIKKITPEYWRARGAQACDDGARIDAHELNHDVAALGDWLRGYRLRELEKMRRPLTVQQLDRVSPP